MTDLRAKLREVLTASDASEAGGGSVYGSKLTSRRVRWFLISLQGLRFESGARAGWAESGPPGGD